MSLDKLLYLRGIGLEYNDYHGDKVVISEDDRRDVLSCMLGNRDVTPELVEAQNYDIDAKPWLLPLADFQWCYIDELMIEVRLLASLKGRLSCSITTESGESYHLEIDLGAPQSEQFQCVGDYYIDGHCYLNYRLYIFPDRHPQLVAGLSLGYHNLSLTYSSDESLLGFESIGLEGMQPYEQQEYLGILMVAPRQAYQGGFATRDQTSISATPWGISAQLYSVRSDRQWGMGDFGDLKELIKQFSMLGASFIQLNPLHGLNYHSQDDISPYSPSDRRRLNAMYIDIEALPEYLHEANEFQLPLWQEERDRLNSAQWVEYDKVYQLKFAALALMYEAFCLHHLHQQTERAERFLKFVEGEGKPLLGYSLFEAQAGLENNKLLQEASSLSARASVACRRVIAKQEFYLYLQFAAQEQLTLCQQLAEKLDMGIGLVRDLAVGAKADGYEVKAGQSLFCVSASIGAPPDDFSIVGQDWGLPPLDPVAMVKGSYQHFIELVRSNLTDAGALRVDHILGLYRLWWWSHIEAEQSCSCSKAGAYVHYPVETLIAILCLESHRAQTMLIGEDLGLVPELIKAQLDRAGIFSNQLFYFCRNDQGFYSPQDFKRHSMLMLANHDVAPLVGWWQQQDIDQAERLGLFANSDVKERALEQRQRHKRDLASQLLGSGQLTFVNGFMCNLEGAWGSEADIETLDQVIAKLTPEVLISTWIRALAETRSSFLCIQLCDLALDTQAVNIPGTWKEYPNWRRRIPLNIEHILAQEWVRDTLSYVNKQRDKR